MTQSYDLRRSDWFIVGLAISTVCATRAVERTLLTELVAGGAFFLILMTLVIAKSKLILFAIVVVFAVLGFANSSRAIGELHRVELGRYSGISRVITDPQRVGAATQIVLDISGDRFVVYAYGRPSWRLSNTSVGETIFVSGWRNNLSSVQAERLVSKHIKGNFEIESVGEQKFIASPINRSAQRVRSLISTGAKSFPFNEQSLFTGLVIGDDSKQSEQMVSAFRKSGLAHLVAVSGQNVAFVLTALSPLLRRLRKTVRLIVTLGVLVWFVVITRVEPSVIRAAVMAGVATLSISLGRPTRTLRILAMTVIVTIFIDPLLAWSVGYYMSVGATTGLCLLSGPLSRVVPGPRWLASLFAATISAQVGVAPAVIFVFGVPAAIGVLANILAVPVASLVMLAGLPLSLFAGAISETAFASLGTIVMWPVLIGVRWVWWVAALGEHLSATGFANFGMWVAVLAMILLLLHRDARVEG